MPWKECSVMDVEARAHHLGCPQERRAPPEKILRDPHSCQEHYPCRAGSFAGQAVGIKEVHEGIWLVSFMEYDLGYFDLETRYSNHWRTHSGQKCYPCSRYVVTYVSGPDPYVSGPDRLTPAVDHHLFTTHPVTSFTRICGLSTWTFVC